MDMSVNIAGVEWKNPVTVASGTFGSGEEFSEYVDLNRLGAVTTKGVANVPWSGNPTPRVAEVYGGMMNAIGLQNPGIELFADGYFIPFIDQTIDICFCCVIRNPAHRSPFRKTTVFAGKCKFQFTGDSFRILKKHFIKVPKTIKKNRIFIRTFCLTVMDHHRR